MFFHSASNDSLQRLWLYNCQGPESTKKEGRPSCTFHANEWGLSHVVLCGLVKKNLKTSECHWYPHKKKPWKLLIYFYLFNKKVSYVEAKPGQLFRVTLPIETSANKTTLVISRWVLMSCAHLETLFLAVLLHDLSVLIKCIQLCVSLQVLFHRHGWHVLLLFMVFPVPRKGSCSTIWHCLQRWCGWIHKLLHPFFRVESKPIDVSKPTPSVHFSVQRTYVFWNIDSVTNLLFVLTEALTAMLQSCRTIGFLLNRKLSLLPIQFIICIFLGGFFGLGCC